MRHNLVAILLVITAMLFTACTNGSKKPINPNGDSELALLMREMATATESWKQELQEGELMTELDLSQLKTAKPTDSTMVSPAFAGFADAYIASVNRFVNEENPSVNTYNQMVDGCANCHNSFCPGPLKRINKMYVKVD